MRLQISAAVFAICLVSGHSFAQSAAPAPTAEALKLARTVVTQMQGDQTVALKAMGTPMIGLIQQMGIREPDRAQVLVQEVIMPVLTAHYGDLLDAQARAYAGALNATDLQAISAFYATPAGRDLTAAQPVLAQAQVAGLTQWTSGLAPELQGKLLQAVRAHGWDASGKTK